MANSGHSVAITSTRAPRAASRASPTSSMPARVAPLAPFGDRPDRRVEGPHRGAAGQQAAHHRQARRVAEVVGAGLERQPEHADERPAQSAAGSDAERPAHLADHPPALLLVDVDDALHHREVVAVVGGDLDERLGVLGEAAAAPTRTRLEERPADPGVRTDALDDVVDVGADRLAHRRDGVDERDLHRQEAVGGVLDRLRRRRVGDQHRGLQRRRRPRRGARRRPDRRRR